MPSTQRVTEQRLKGRVNHDPTSSVDATKMGHLVATPQRPY
jgi:hypothetical protein